jgi:hypothetical protein
MTREELELEILKGIDRRGVQTFLPAGLDAAEIQHFNELIERLQDMKRLGWIELEIAEKRSRAGKDRGNYIAAVARCTEHGRQVLRLLGE